jgi:hypothetical protein
MEAIDHLEHQKALFQIRQRAARRDGILFVVLLAAVWLVTFVMSRTGYEPGFRSLLLWLFLSLSDVVLLAAKVAEHRMLKEMVELVEALQRAME